MMWWNITNSERNCTA